MFTVCEVPIKFPSSLTTLTIGPAAEAEKEIGELFAATFTPLISAFFPMSPHSEWVLGSVIMTQDPVSTLKIGSEIL